MTGQGNRDRVKQLVTGRGKGGKGKRKLEELVKVVVEATPRSALVVRHDARSRWSVNWKEATTKKEEKEKRREKRIWRTRGI